MKVCRNKFCNKEYEKDLEFWPANYCSIQCLPTIHHAEAVKREVCKNSECSTPWDKEWDIELKGYCSRKCKEKIFDKGSRELFKNREYYSELAPLSRMFFDQPMKYKGISLANRELFKYVDMQKVENGMFMAKFVNNYEESLSILVPENEINKYTTKEQYKLILYKEILVPYNE